MDTTPVYSHHTFLYPFLYLDESSRFRQDSFEKFYRLFAENHEWWKEEIRFSKGAEDEELRLDYQVFQYFNSSTRRTLFERQASRSYSLCFPEGKGTYEIQPPSDVCTEAIHQPIALQLKAIRIKIFNTGVAVLVYETEYRPDEGLTPKQKRERVKLINEYGRRLYPAYLPSASLPCEGSKMPCAERITIRIPGMEPICDDFRSRAEAYLPGDSTENAKGYLHNLIFLPDIVGEILNLGLAPQKIYCNEPRKEQEREEAGGTFKIKPAIDDRMFVCCMIRDSSYVESFLGYPTDEKAYNAQYKAAHPSEPVSPVPRRLRRQSHTWKFRTDWLVGQELYALTNIDGNVSDPEDSTCQNRVDLDRYFDEQLYLRWIEYGTIHSVTNHSMMCLTSEAPNVDHIVNAFLILYVPICILTLAQRASLLAFDDRITRCVSPAQGRGQLNKEKRDELYGIAEDFSVFQGEILLAEVTPQIQGIELYEKLQNMLFIARLEKNVQNQLNNLFQIARSRQEDEKLAEDEKINRRERRQDVFLVFLGLYFSILVIPSSLGFNSHFGNLFLIVISVVALGVFLVFICSFLYSWGKDKKRRKNRR